MNAELWHGYILEKINATESLIKSVSTIDGAQERSATLEDAEDELQEIQRKDLRQFKFEVRLVKDSNERHNLEKDLRKVQIKLQAVKGYLTSTKAGERRRELLNGDEGDQALAQTSLIQDETQSSISNIKRMIEESKNVGTSSLEELRRQRKVISKVDREADKASDKLSRSQKLVKRFQRGNFFHKL
mmetsp:Transcript_42989/g.104078  ORF Transcript_42989/g.104078 Transcript_42989/m.104078 type:complete len:187 (+) Transcript_42989:3-563(+)